jgi:hypothetical protein
MNTNTARYRVDIPAYAVVYLDNDLRPVSHELDLATPILYPRHMEPMVTDYHDPNTEMPVVITDMDMAQDEYQNALDYARGLCTYHAIQIVRASSTDELLDSEEPF